MDVTAGNAADVSNNISSTDTTIERSRVAADSIASIRATPKSVRAADSENETFYTVRSRETTDSSMDISDAGLSPISAKSVDEDDCFHVSMLGMDALGMEGTPDAVSSAYYSRCVDKVDTGYPSTPTTPRPTTASPHKDRHSSSGRKVRFDLSRETEYSDSMTEHSMWEEESTLRFLTPLVAAAGSKSKSASKYNTATHHSPGSIVSSNVADSFLSLKTTDMEDRLKKARPPSR